jgi:hypothetical protein
MDTLQKILELDIPKIEFIDRKYQISSTKTLLYGPPRSGKTYISYDFISNFDAKKRLYIDLADLRIEASKIEEFLQDFITANHIEAVVIDNYEQNIKIPQCENIVLISKKSYQIDGFEKILILPLDFEEFLAHDTKHQNITTSFNNFFRFGNLSENMTLQDSKKSKKLQEMLKLNTKDELELQAIKNIINSFGEKTSVFNLFNQLKRTTKVSKDRFYELCKSYEEQHIIFFVSKYNQPKAMKKLFLYNHALKNAISFGKNFKNEFSNMVFLELVRKYHEITYLDGVDFYIPYNNSVILCIPFFNDFMISSVSNKIFPLLDEYKISNITIICVNDLQQTFFIGEIECNVVPFFVWALL